MSATGDALLKIAQANPDITIHDETPTIRRDTWAQDANSGAQGRLETTQGNNFNPTHVTTPESPLEAKFLQLWVMLGGPELKPQHKFEPTRGWIADFVHLDSKTIIEIDGGMYIGGIGGRHNRAHGYQRDRERDNWATMTGWRVIRLTSAMLTPDYIESIIQWMEDEA